MFIETNPQPIKKAMELLGYCSAACRLPLVNCSEESAEKIRQELSAHDML
jgi:4-hydroxy-tetrahydrodipicolinate synthase